MEHYKRGDWVTIQSEPWFHRGARGVVADVKVSRMTVAYCVDQRIETRHVKIDSVTRGHDAQGRSMEQVASSFTDLKIDAVREAVQMGIAAGSLTAEQGERVVVGYESKLRVPERAKQTARIEGERRLLAEWLAEH